MRKLDGEGFSINNLDQQLVPYKVREAEAAVSAPLQPIRYVSHRPSRPSGVEAEEEAALPRDGNLAP